MADALLERLTFSAPDEVRSKFIPLDYPADAKPKLVSVPRDPNASMPEVDTVVCMWTAAEKQAVADVFNAPEDEWNFYAKDFASYEDELTGRSPAKEAKRLAEYAVETIDGRRVALVHSQLHLATDSTKLPLRRLIAQIIRDTGCKNWIDTGTSGGIGSRVVVGDTVAAGNLIFDCTGDFKNESFAHQSFPTTMTLPEEWSAAIAMMSVNAGLLRPQTTRELKVWNADVITCDSFLFDMVGDPFGLEKYDGGRALAEEMDASVLGLVAQDLGDAMPQYASLRSVSDPRMPGGTIQAAKKAASKIYDDFGYAAQVPTSVAVGFLISSLA